ncbi:helix-turn-helix domain-containing protein [Caballeronia sp. SBC2]|uniref:helix-turn-helix domain-containing protein n=1 Tax=Caballeronia sp. SBC2 TaxID=2705547 RepID=UPI0013E1CFF8|nr:helix-turn-helix domain-containing protein [Caballeronia sp. SBC2]QIE29552.1 Helix-turn-helix domain protein [Caballeronia sp. SBC2]
MPENNPYQQLQPEERLTIANLHLQGSSIRAMALILGRSPATVSRAYRQDELDATADSLNSRPRATHAFHSPFEVFAATLASASQPQGAKH